MPRLTTKDYLRQRLHLAGMWLKQQRLYGDLSSREQGALHEFFRQTEDLSPDEVVAHRGQITSRWPSLPAMAGRAYAKLANLAESYVAVPPPPVKQIPPLNIRVRAIRRPKPDLERSAKALIQVALEDQERELQRRQEL